MSTTKRIKITCWNEKECGRSYTQLHQFDGRPTLNVHCPYCDKPGVVDLTPYNAWVKDIYASQDAEPFTLPALKLPDILPSQPLPAGAEE